MLPLIAIAAFFLLGVAFFIFGKDDFGITRLKEVSNDTNLKENKVTSLKSVTNSESQKASKELVNIERSSDVNADSNTSV